MVAGLLADLCVEHHKCVRDVDRAELDPAMVGAYIHKFKQRVRILFTEGHIMKLKHCYTAQVIDFFRNPSVIFDRDTALMFARPDPNDTDAVYEPLERIRSIVGNVVACLEAAVPEDGWHHSFAAFYLPSPLGTFRPGTRAAQRNARAQFVRIMVQAGWSEQQCDLTLTELESVVLAAEAHKKAMSCDNRAAWAHATIDFPEKENARKLITLYLGRSATTANVERDLKRVAKRQEVSPKAELPDLMLCDLHAPRASSAGGGATPPVCGGRHTEQTMVENYIKAMCKVYGDVFGGRLWRQAPKRRRDKGMKHTSKRRKDTERNGLLCKLRFPRHLFVSPRPTRLRQICPTTPHHSTCPP